MGDNNEKWQIEKDIESLREVLNEICIKGDDKETIEKRLLVSTDLDKLIVEYINKKNN